MAGQRAGPGKALGMRIDAFDMGHGGTPSVEVVARADNPDAARVKRVRPRRIYVGSDFDRLCVDYLCTCCLPCIRIRRRCQPGRAAAQKFR